MFYSEWNNKVFNKDGIVLRVVIEWKNYNQKNSIGWVRDYFGVLYDVSNIKGIMACKEGYQVGAKKFADYYGISLMELRAPKDGETMIGVLDIKWNINVTHQLYLVDEEWAAKHGYIFVSYREWLDYRRIKRDNKWSKSTHLPLNTSDDYIRDEKGNVITSIEYLKKREPDNKPNDNTIIYCLKDSYVQTRDCGLVKINEVMFEDEHLVKENTYSLDAGYFVRAILEDALGGEKMMIL